jgi:hypothetical protein
LLSRKLQRVPIERTRCSRLEADYAQLRSGPTNNSEWGTVEFGGASGGPEVQYFGVTPAGAPPEILGGNIVVSVTSYTYSAATRVDGGSIFGAPEQFAGNTFGDLINTVCGPANHPTGNC